METFRVRVTFGDNKRLISVPKDCDWSEFVGKLRSCFNIKEHLKLKVTDHLDYAIQDIGVLRDEDQLLLGVVGTLSNEVPPSKKRKKGDSPKALFGPPSKQIKV